MMHKSEETHAPIERDRLLDICAKAREGLKAEGEDRIQRYVNNRYNAWWRKAIRAMGLPCATKAQFEAEGRWHLDHTWESLFVAREFNDGSFWSLLALSKVEEIEHLMAVSEGPVNVSAKDLNTLMDYVNYTLDVRGC